MHSTALYQLFDPAPYLSALALIRIPHRLDQTQPKPAPDDDFGSAFFITASGVLLTAAHNLTINGKPGGDLLPWVWVCCFDSGTKDWTDAIKVGVRASLVDRNLDVAVLRLERFRTIEPLKVAADWAKGNNIAVLGFQPDPNRASGFDVHWLPCAIPFNFPVAPFDITTDAHEPALRLLPIDGQAPLGKGISGGPALNLDCEGNPAIAIEKAETEGFELRSAEVKTTAIRWVRNLLEQLPEAREAVWLSKRDVPGVPHDIRRPGAMAPDHRQHHAVVAPSRPAMLGGATGPQRDGARTGPHPRPWLRTVLPFALPAVALWATTALPVWNTLDVDIVGPQAQQVVRLLSGSDGEPDVRLATDAVVRDGQGSALELTRQFNPAFEGKSGFGRGWRLFLPLSMTLDSTESTIVLGNLIGPKRIRATNHVTGDTMTLTYEDRPSGESGYFGAGLERFGRLVIQTNGGFFLRDRSGRELQFDPVLHPVVVDAGSGGRWVYHYSEDRLAAIRSLPERLTADNGFQSGDLRVVDRLDAATLRFVSEADGLRRFEPDAAGRWSHATMNQVLTIRLYDRWNNEFIFQGPEEFIILNNATASPAEPGAVRSGITFGYDSLGRVDRATIAGQGDVRYEYDDDDRLVAVVGLDGSRIRYRYDTAGLPVRQMSRRTLALRLLPAVAGTALMLYPLLRLLRDSRHRRPARAAAAPAVFR
jgi:YD repeat-containing protein